MEIWVSIGEHWFEVIQTIGIVIGFIFTVHTIRKDNEARRISNMISLAHEHREIWQQFYGRPELSRIRDVGAALDTKPLTYEEQIFVSSLILHLSVVYEAMKARMFVHIEGLGKDIKAVFSLPIPKAIWETSKLYQNSDFVAFIESAMK